jgi:vancomycin resistance protein YoaR
MNFAVLRAAVSKVESIIAKGKFETPRNGAAKSSTAAKTKAAKPSKAAKTVAAGKTGGKKKTGVLVGAIAAVAICVGVGVGALWYTGALSPETTTTPTASIAPVEELTNRTDYTDIYPNVYIGELNVGGLSTEEALTALRDYVSEDVSQSLWVTLSNDQVLTFDITAAVSEEALQNLVTEAWNHGREGDADAQAAALEAAEAGETFTVELSTYSEPDLDDLRAQVDKYAEELNQEAVQTEVAEDATKLDDGTYVMEVTKGTCGVSFDADLLYLTVAEAATNGNFDPIDFDADITEPDEPDYEALAELWNKEPENARYDVDTESVVEGTYGYSVDMDTVAQLLDAAEEGETIQVPVTILSPEIDKATMESRLFADTLSTKSTTYTNNANRTTNLRLACEAINGTVIQPGEVFSFNNIVGERTEEKGYKAATVYAEGGKNDEQLGGGICQVASTIYYCTLYANLEIVERTEHMYRVEYIDYGIDATIYWGSLDYKFRNDTDYPIKIEASVTDRVNITFLGTKTDDTYVVMEVEQTSTTPYSVITEVDESKPVGYSEVTQTAYTGYSYTSYRCVYAADGTLISRTHEADSTHIKRDRIITVGPSASTTTTTPTESTTPAETTTPAESTTPSESTPTPSETTTPSAAPETPVTETPVETAPETPANPGTDSMVTD